MPRLPSFTQRLKRAKASPKGGEDRDVQQIEGYYRRQGYSDPAVEEKGANDYEIAQRLRKKKRGLRGVMLGGIDN